MPMTKRCIPYTPRRRDLRDTTFMLVTTAGVHRRDQEPYDVAGDNSWWLIAGDTATSDLMVTHSHYDHQHAEVIASRLRVMGAPNTVTGWAGANT
jgi:D-proline reductase (dithiol) PrdB